MEGKGNKKRDMKNKKTYGGAGKNQFWKDKRDKKKQKTENSGREGNYELKQI
jgi:hypothetical protein